MAFLRSCRATNGHNTQFTSTDATTPIQIAPPLVAATMDGEGVPSVLYSPIETTTNEMQPVITDFFDGVNNAGLELGKSGRFFTHWMGGLGESIQHWAHED
jgi:hypothetical protein